MCVWVRRGNSRAWCVSVTGVMEMRHARRIGMNAETQRNWREMRKAGDTHKQLPVNVHGHTHHIAKPIDTHHIEAKS